MVNCGLCGKKLTLKSFKQLIKTSETNSISCCDECIERYNISKK